MMLRVPEDLRERVKEAARLNDEPVARLVRRALKEEVERLAHEKA